MQISRELLYAINQSFNKFPDSKIEIGEAFQYDTSFVAKSAIGSLGVNSETVNVYACMKTGDGLQMVKIRIGKDHYSNYAHEKGVKADGQTVQNIQEFFEEQKWPQFLLVRRVGSSNWEGSDPLKWDTITIMPCGFYNPS